MIVEAYKEIVGSGWGKSFIVFDCGGIEKVGKESFAGVIIEPNDTLSEVENFLEIAIGLKVGLVVIDFYQLIDETSKEINEKIVEINQIIKKYCKDYKDTKSYEFRASYCRKDLWERIKEEPIKMIQAIGDNISEGINNIEYWKNNYVYLSLTKNITQKELTKFWLNELGIKAGDITKFNGYDSIEILDAADSCNGDFSVCMIFDDNGNYIKTEVYEN